eukprot:12842426-Prorocentrum_lima.AAC.1
MERHGLPRATKVHRKRRRAMGELHGAGREAQHALATPRSGYDGQCRTLESKGTGVMKPGSGS